MIASPSSSESRREQMEFEQVTQRSCSTESFLWQEYALPDPLPTTIEAHEYEHTSTSWVTQLQEDKARLQRCMRLLKKGWRDRNLDRVDTALAKLNPVVQRLRLAYRAESPHRPLPPHWMQYARRIRTDKPNYGQRVGCALEGLAWGQALDDFFEMEPQPLALGSSLREWGRCFTAEPLSHLRAAHERNTVRLLQRRVAPEKLELRAQSYGERVYQALVAPASLCGLTNLVMEDMGMRINLFHLRVTLMALNTPIDLLPARRNQFRLAGGEPHENAEAWRRHVSAWCASRITGASFSQATPLRLALGEPGLCDKVTPDC